MKRDDFFSSPLKKLNNTILFSGRGFVHFTDECFIIASGDGETLASDTALWAYKLVRTRPYYWEAKREFMKRIFRTVNLTLWQRHEVSSLIVAIVVDNYYWIGSAGNVISFLYRDGLIDVLTQPNEKQVGYARPQLIPETSSGRFLENDQLLLTTQSASNFVNEDQLREIFEGEWGSIYEMPSCMIKRVMI